MTLRRDVLAEAAAVQGESLALLLPYFAHLGAHYAQYTFARLNGIAARLAARLLAAGVRRGDRVGVLTDNAGRAIEIIHALWRAGAVVVPLNTRWTADELRYALEIAECRLLLCDSAHEGRAFAAAGDVPVRTLKPGARASAEALPDLDHFSGAADDLIDGVIDDEAVAVVLFTSGTTGKPKGAQLTHGGLIAGARASAARIGALPGDRWLLSLPLYHVGGLAMLYRSCLDGSALVLMPPERDTDAIARAITSQRVTLVSLVPTQLYRLLEMGFRAPPTLRVMLIGGAAADDRLIARALDAGLPIALTYGMTEAGSQIATMTPAGTVGKPGSVGKPLEGLRLRVVDGGGAVCPPGEVGTIQVAGAALMRGYLGQPPILDWFDTGDLGYLDVDGDLWVVQRRTDLIVSGGENVYPSEVEAVLRAHPDVLEVCVVGLPDAEWGQRVGALIVPRHDSSLDLDALAVYARARLAGYKQPRVVQVVEVLPLTASGKIDRRAAAALLAESVRQT